MKERYIREGFLYSEEDLMELLDINPMVSDERNKFGRYMKSLKQRKLLKSRKRRSDKSIEVDDASLMLEDDSDFYDFVGNETDGIQYIFRFVGIIYFDDIVIYVYPKYIESTKEPREQMKKIIKVLLKHEGKKYVIDVPEMLEYEEGKNDLNLLSVIMYLVNDYVENGLYNEDESVYEHNGEGRIDWQRTIDNFYPIISNESPYYVEVITNRNVSNEMNFCVRLHKHILTEATQELQKVGLSDVFNLPVLELEDDEDYDFNNYQLVHDEIDTEMRIQFDDRKSSVLRAIDLYIALKDKEQLRYQETGEAVMKFFGTRAFHVIWEDIISEVYVSQKKMTFKEIISEYVPKLGYHIHLPNGSSADIDCDMKLGSIIEKPTWTLRNSRTGKLDDYYPDETFIPDYLRFNETCDEFYILDAKYYLPRWFTTSNGNNTIIHQPGVEDVAKQYMYYMAYRPLLEHNHISISKVKNYFILPTEEDSEDIGYAKLDMFSSILLDIFDIRVKKINCEHLYDCYLQEIRLNVESI